MPSTWAGNFSSYARKLRHFSGTAIPYYTMSYVSSEGVFEFIPADGPNADDESEQPDTVFMDELEEGKEYELVITNQSGFYRYRMGDVIRVTGFFKEAPTVVFKYRKKNIVSIAGEKFTEDDLLSAVKEFERRTGVSVIDFCMYPDRDSEPGKYVVYMEPEEIVPQEKHEQFREILSEELLRANASYTVYRHGGSMGKAVDFNNFINLR